MSCLVKMPKDEGSLESHRYYLSRKTVLEMLRDRGYDVPINDIQQTLQEFRTVYGQHPDTDLLRVTVSHSSDPSNRMMVLYCENTTVKVHAVRIIAGLVATERLTGLILILQSDITTQATRALECFSFNVETFQITDLLVNITKHVLTPKHRVLTDEEKGELLKKYNLVEKELPRLTLDDAIAKYYGYEKGQVVEIVYGGRQMIDKHVAYRCVW